MRTSCRLRRETRFFSRKRSMRLVVRNSVSGISCRAQPCPIRHPQEPRLHSPLALIAMMHSVCRHSYQDDMQAGGAAGLTRNL